MIASRNTTNKWEGIKKNNEKGMDYGETQKDADLFYILRMRYAV
jgi:hypothetical protein